MSFWLMHLMHHIVMYNLEWWDSDPGSQLCVIMSILNRSYRIGLVTHSLPMEDEVAGLCV